MLAFCCFPLYNASNPDRGQTAQAGQYSTKARSNISLPSASKVAFNEAVVPAFEPQPLAGLHADPPPMLGELGSSHAATGRDTV